MENTKNGIDQSGNNEVLSLFHSVPGGSNHQALPLLNKNADLIAETVYKVVPKIAFALFPAFFESSYGKQLLTEWQQDMIGEFYGLLVKDLNQLDNPNISKWICCYCKKACENMLRQKVRNYLRRKRKFRKYQEQSPRTGEKTSFSEISEMKPLPFLNQQQNRVWNLKLLEKTNREIAEELGLSERRIEQIMKSIVKIFKETDAVSEWFGIKEIRKCTYQVKDNPPAEPTTSGTAFRKNKTRVKEIDQELWWNQKFEESRRWWLSWAS